MDLDRLGAMMQQRLDNLNRNLDRRVNKLGETLSERFDKLQCAWSQQSNELQESLARRIDESLDRSRKLRESSFERLNQRYEALLERGHNTLIQRNNELQESLTECLHELMLRQSKELQESSVRQLDDSVAQRIKVLQKKLDRDMIKFHNKAIQPQSDRISDRLTARDTGIKRGFQYLDKQFNYTDARAHTMEIGTRRKLNNVSQQLTRMETRLERVETVKSERVEAGEDPLDVEIDNSRIILPNPNIVLLNQRSKLSSLIHYNRLQQEVIRATTINDRSFTDTKLEYTEEDLNRAISSNAWEVVTVLGRRLGVDCDALRDQILRMQFHSQKNASTKRGGNNMSNTNERAAKAYRPS
ncbi:hypothetical protein BDV26DRAFT_297420 [Aspergillus bertholletiae]|uniref:Uncharacterized protein n=1 Tax=Aspergillus bertholletiae TaxID=1226010 RepID=A0A5N7ASU2_9EURO|nr:hypothetical protein BDV26DRAFT_297420 [Aspergillus bertholletiae]